MALILEENLDLSSPKIKELRRRLFGFWEMNWVAFNSARDFVLPQAKNSINYFMYPIVEVDGETRDSYSPEACGYTIKSS